MNARIVFALALGITLTPLGKSAASSLQTGQDKARLQTVKGNPVTRARVAQMIYDAFSARLDRLSRTHPRPTQYRDVASKDSNYHAIATLSRLSVATGDEQG